MRTIYVVSFKEMPRLDDAFMHAEDMLKYIINIIYKLCRSEDNR